MYREPSAAAAAAADSSSDGANLSPSHHPKVPLALPAPSCSLRPAGPAPLLLCVREQARPQRWVVEPGAEAVVSYVRIFSFLIGGSAPKSGLIESLDRTFHSTLQKIKTCIVYRPYHADIGLISVLSDIEDCDTDTVSEVKI